MPGIRVIGEAGEYQTLVDTLGYYLSHPPIADPRFASQPDTTITHWVVNGDIGLGPGPGLPVGYIAPLNDSIVPYGKGGSTGGPFGSDMDEFTVPILLIQGEHKVEPPIEATAIENPGYLEQPGGRALMELVQNVRKALRVEGTFGGAVATSSITEIRPMLINLDDKLYRGARLTLTARQRRPR
jgi:hypothetical protein